MATNNKTMMLFMTIMTIWLMQEQLRGAFAFTFGLPVVFRRPSTVSLQSSFLQHQQQQQQEQQQRQQSLVLAAAASASSTSIISPVAYNAPLSQQASPTGTNSKYKHLFRHVEDISLDCWLRVTDAHEFLLSVGYTNDEIDKLAKDEPKLLTMSVHDVLAPKIRFLVSTLDGGTGGQLEWIEDTKDQQEEKAPASSLSSQSSSTLGDELIDDECRVDYNVETVHHSLRLYPETRRIVPASFFVPQLRLEKILAPRHAYLQFFNLPHSAQDLLYFRHGQRFQQFLNEGCASSATNFAQLCTKWASRNLPPMGGSITQIEILHTTETVRAMERAFASGLLAAAKNVVTPDLQVLNMTPGQLVELLVSHGANTMESDNHGVSLLHWAAGTGNLVGLQALLRKEVETTASLLHDENNNEQDVPAITQVILLDDTTKDGSTPIHWAASGVGPTGFCAGGHANVCRYLLESVSSSSTTSPSSSTEEIIVDDKAIALANAETDIGTTPIMLAAWSGSLETVQVLIQYGKANPHAVNVEGYSAAHFAASAGHLHVCQYLHETFSMDFVHATTAVVENDNSDHHDSSNDRKFISPLASAIAYDRKEVVEWIQNTFPETASSSSSSS